MARPRRRDAFWVRQRKNLLTGLVVILPLYLTYWIISSAVALIDQQAQETLPSAWNPQNYLNIPGLGLVVFVLLAVGVGALARNFIVAQVIGWGEGMLERLPIVRSIYNALKQIAETLFTDTQRSFQKACLVEYPRRDAWVIGFIATDAQAEVKHRLPDEQFVAVFVPTTPNPTSGFLVYVERKDVIELDMSIEEAAKLVISAGLVNPPERKPVNKAASPKG